MASKRQGMKKRAKVAKAKKEIDKGNVKALANSMRVQLLTILNERANSTTGLARELGVEPGEIAYDIEVLRDTGRIEVVGEKKRRGAMEVFYKATSRAHLDELEWPTVPDPVKGGLRASLLQTITADAIAAIDEDTFDSVEGAHMSWTPLIVDGPGWEELAEILRVALDGVLKVSKSSAERLIANDEEGTSCTVSILGYAAALDERKVGPPIDADTLAGTTKQPRSKAKRASRKTAAAKKTKTAGKSSTAKTTSKSKRGKSKGQ
jgi:DNA-binding transcriptional ArsR family regulator